MARLDLAQPSQHRFCHETMIQNPAQARFVVSPLLLRSAESGGTDVTPPGGVDLSSRVTVRQSGWRKGELTNLLNPGLLSAVVRACECANRKATAAQACHAE